MKRSLPDEIVLNGDVMKCGTELQDAEKCSCRALICDGENVCKHQTSTYGLYRYVLGCELAKPWDQINTQDATSGREASDCGCIARRVRA